MFSMRFKVSLSSTHSYYSTTVLLFVKNISWVWLACRFSRLTVTEGAVLLVSMDSCWPSNL
jgi:hypothetical protein